METECEMEQNIQKVVEFWLGLYGRKYRVRKTLKSQMRGLRLSNQVSRDQPPPYQAPLDTVDILRFQIILKKFVKDIAAIKARKLNIANLGDFANRIQFLRAEYNEMVSRMQGKFLPGFGPIYAWEVSMPELQYLPMFFEKLQKARKLPLQLAFLHEKDNRVAINTSLNFYVQVAKQNASNEEIKQTPSNILPAAIYEILKEYFIV